MVGLAVLTVRRRTAPLHSAQGTRRALFYALIYGLCSASFMRVIGSAVLGVERSPWLLALGDVIFVTLGIFAWVIALAEGHSLADYGFRKMEAGRLLLTLLMGLGPVVVFAMHPYRELLSFRLPTPADSVVFAFLYASLGATLPDELIFRGYLMSTLDGRTSQWARVAMPAVAFTAVRALRLLPGVGLGSEDWMFYILGFALPLGLWWGLMRELAGGALWPCLISHFLLEFGITLAGASPALR